MSDADTTVARAAGGDAVAVRTVDSDRGSVAYAEYGDPEGVPLLFFHGTPGSRLLGELYDDAARERGMRVLALDRPGYGDSDPWEDRTLANTGAFATPVLADAGVDSAGVVGFSGGGPHALAFAASHPGSVRRVDLVAGATPPDCGPADSRSQRMLGTLAARAPWLLSRVLGVQVWLARRKPSLVVGQYTSDDTDDLSGDVATLVGQDFVTGLASSRAGLATEARLFTRAWDFPLERVTAPVALWHGTRDGNVSIEGARELQTRLPEAELTTFETDHLRTLLASREAVLDRQAAAGREARRRA
jgi:pimeloyl-ACP methyl ester carboxylesterase